MSVLDRLVVDGRPAMVGWFDARMRPVDGASASVEWAKAVFEDGATMFYRVRPAAATVVVDGQ